MRKNLLKITILVIVIFLAIANVTNIKAANGTNTLIWVDTPTENQSMEKGKFEIQGWIMTEYAGAETQIFLDNTRIYTTITRQVRPDVLNSIRGYGSISTNEKPGFKAIIDLTNISNGSHTLKIRSVKKDHASVLAEKNIIIRVGIYDTIIWIDNPNTLHKEYKNLNATGWVLSSSKDAKIEAYIDNNKISEQIQRIQRPDVLNAITGYGGKNTNITPGFNANINISNLKPGTHKFSIKAYSQSGELLQTKEVNFNIKSPETLLQSDYPVINQSVKTSLHVQGWTLSEDSKNKVEVVLNGTTYQTQRQVRPDVLNAIKGYGGSSTNSKPGYIVDIDTTGIKNGTYNVTTRVVSELGQVLSQETRKINIHKYDSILQFDTPVNNQKIKSNIEVQGWTLTEDKNAKVEIIVGGKTYSPERQVRADVLKAITGYGGAAKNATPGYKTNISTENLKDGNNTITVRVISSKTGEILKQQSRNIVVHKYDGLVNIDEPMVTMVNTSTIKVQGWELSENKNSTVKIYIDNKQMSTKITRQERQDVLNAIKGYGGAAKNATPGFLATVNVANLSEGKHIIKVTSFSNLGDIIASAEKTIQIYHNKYFGIDVSRWQGTINFDKLTASKKIDFMIAKSGEYWESKKAFQLDSQFERNYSEAKKRNIPFGTYLYSYATNVERAKTEANELVSYLKKTGKTFELPIFFDIEDKTQTSLSKQDKTNICKAFGEIIQNAGYKVGIYSSKYWLMNQIDLAQIPSSYDIWVASYGANNGTVPASKYEFAGNHDIWQYTSTGKIDGISGNVDFNISYKKY